MLSADEFAQLETYSGQAGIFLERGLFGHGVLLAARRTIRGYVEIDIQSPSGTILNVGSLEMELSQFALQARGWVSWTWVFGVEAIAAIESAIITSPEDRHPYDLARKVLAQMLGD